MADRILDPATGVYLREMAGRQGRDAAQNDQITRVWLAYDNADPLVCRQAMVNQKANIQLEEFANLVIDSLDWKLYAGENKWQFTAVYAPVPKVGGYTITMDSGGGEVNITSAFAQVGYPAPGQTLPTAIGTLLNVQPGGEVRGSRKVAPALKLNIRAKIDSGFLSDQMAYAKLVASVTGYTNSTEYLTFAPGELLFRGASGEIVGQNPTLSFTFEASPNRANFAQGGVSGISAEGHDELWFYMRAVADATTKLRVPSARGALVGTKYEKRDFSVLRIGQTS